MAKMLLRLRAPWNSETSPYLRGKREWKRQRNPHCQGSVWVWNLIILPLNPIARIPIDFKRRMIWQHFISSLCTSECIMVSFKPIHLFQPLLEDRVLTAGRRGGEERSCFIYNTIQIKKVNQTITNTFRIAEKPIIKELQGFCLHILTSSFL